MTIVTISMETIGRWLAIGTMRNRLALALIVAALTALAGPAMSTASSEGAVVTLKTVRVGAPGNPSVGIVPFTDAIYRSCAEAPSPRKAV